MSELGQRVMAAYYRGTHPYSFRSGATAEIIGVRIVTPNEDLPARPCFEVRHEDGVIDLCPIDDKENYEIVVKPIE